MRNQVTLSGEWERILKRRRHDRETRRLQGTSSSSSVRPSLQTHTILYYTLWDGHKQQNKYVSYYLYAVEDDGEEEEEDDHFDETGEIRSSVTISASASSK